MIFIANDKENNPDTLRQRRKPVLSTAKSIAKELKADTPKSRTPNESCDKVLMRWVNHKIASQPPFVSDISSLPKGESSTMVESHESLVHRKALALYESQFKSILRVVKGEVDEGKFIVREDRDVLLDLGLRETLFEILFSYELPWLRIGCEIIFGGIISAPAGKEFSRDISSVESKTLWKPILKAFICDRLLNDPQIQDQFSHSKLLSAANERKLKSELLRHFAHRFIAIALFLDKARLNAVLPTPMLFRKDASIKSSKEVLSLFCRNFLRAEGDIMKHLSSLGCNAIFEQTYVHEFDFTVKDIDKDMRDGVRLCRLVEVLFAHTDLCSCLRVPAISRLQKLHNVGIAMAQLKTHFSVLAAEAKEIVDGGRKIVDLLWQLSLEFELKEKISCRIVLLEAMQIRSNSSWRRTVYPADIASKLPIKVPYNHPTTGEVVSAACEYSSLESAATAEDTDLSSALVEWCDSVAAQYGVPVINLREDLADGKALCLLMHYYHPSLLPVTLISESARDIPEGLCSLGAIELAIQGEHRNNALFRKACLAIPGIPQLLPTKMDSNCIPDERAMKLFLGFLFCRLVESSKQTLASVRIQRAVRFYLLEKSGPKYPTPRKPTSWSSMKRVRSPKIVLRSNHKPDLLALSRRQSSSYKILDFLKRCVEKKNKLRKQLETVHHRKSTSLLELQAEISRNLVYERATRIFHTSAIKLQKFVRMARIRRSYIFQRRRVICLQRRVRSFFAYRRARSKIILQRRASRTICRFMISFIFLRRQERKIRSKSRPRDGIAIFQAIIRGFLVRNTLSSTEKARITRVKTASFDASVGNSLKLSSRTAHALVALENGNTDSGELQKLCTTLELSTSLSRACCEQLACGAASTLLFRLIRSCNRSVEHQEVLR